MKPKVLFMTPWYPTADRPTRGVYVQEHAKAANMVARVAVLHMDTTPLHMDTTPLRQVWEVERDDLVDLPTWRVRWSRPRFLPKLPFRALATIVGYQRIRRSWGRPDVIHANVYSAGLLAVLIGRVTRTPVVITEHSAKFDNPRVSVAATVSARIAYSLADQVLPVSGYLQRVLERKGLSGCFTVVPNVVDMDVFQPPVGRRNGQGLLLFVGALRQGNQKNLPGLLRACRMLMEEGVAFQLVVIGDGPLKRECEALVAELQMSDRVTFRGEVTKREVAEAMRNSTLYVSASRGESFCCPLAEAQASGLPCVATDVGASRETLSPEGGVLVAPDDPRALADGIHAVLADSRRWDRNVIAASARRFSAEAVATAFAAVYGDVLSRRRLIPAEVDLASGGRPG